MLDCVVAIRIHNYHFQILHQFLDNQVDRLLNLFVLWYQTFQHTYSTCIVHYFQEVSDRYIQYSLDVLETEFTHYFLYEVGALRVHD